MPRPRPEDRFKKEKEWKTKKDVQKIQKRIEEIEQKNPPCPNCNNPLIWKKHKGRLFFHCKKCLMSDCISMEKGKNYSELIDRFSNASKTNSPESPVYYLNGQNCFVSHKRFKEMLVMEVKKEIHSNLWVPIIERAKDPYAFMIALFRYYDKEINVEEFDKYLQRGSFRDRDHNRSEIEKLLGKRRMRSYGKHAKH